MESGQPYDDARNLTDESIELYMDALHKHLVPSSIQVLPSGDVCLVVGDEHFPNSAETDNLKMFVVDMRLGNHGYLMVTIENVTAKEERKQTRGYRTSFNIIYCPVALVGNQLYHVTHDLLCASVVARGKLTIMSSSAGSAFKEVERNKSPIDRVIQLHREGNIHIVQSSCQLESWLDVHDYMHATNKLKVLLDSMARRRFCPMCKLHIKVIDDNDVEKQIESLAKNLLGKMGYVKNDSENGSPSE